MAYCTKCGQQNQENNAFCVRCGNPMNSDGRKPGMASDRPKDVPVAPTYSAQPGVYNDGGMEAKSKRNLLMAIIIAATVVVLLIVVFAGGVSPKGIWYDETNSAALEFYDGENVYRYTSGGMKDGKYEYNTLKGEGRMALGGKIYAFTIVKDKLILENADIYLHMDKNFDIARFVYGSADSSPIMEESAAPTETRPPESPVAEEQEKAEALPLTLSFLFGSADGTYSGEMKGGLPNGTGEFTAINSDGLSWIYTGMWADGHFSGEGVRTWEDGYARGGTYANDHINGVGWQGWYGNTEYEGGYIDSEFNGQGTLYNFYGTYIYSGAFNNGLIQESVEEKAARVGAFIEKCGSYTYDEAVAACDTKKELFVQMTGTVYDVDEADYEDESNPAWVYMELPPGEDGLINYITVRYWMSEGEVLPEVGQAVTIWGTTRTNEYYTSESGGEWFEPVIEAWDIKNAL